MSLETGLLILGGLGIILTVLWGYECLTMKGQDYEIRRHRKGE